MKEYVDKISKAWRTKYFYLLGTQKNNHKKKDPFKKFETGKIILSVILGFREGIKTKKEIFEWWDVNQRNLMTEYPQTLGLKRRLDHTLIPILGRGNQYQSLTVEKSVGGGCHRELGDLLSPSQYRGTALTCHCLSRTVTSSLCTMWEYKPFLFLYLCFPLNLLHLTLKLKWSLITGDTAGVFLLMLRCFLKRNENFKQYSELFRNNFCTCTSNHTIIQCT